MLWAPFPSHDYLDRAGWEVQVPNDGAVHWIAVHVDNDGPAFGEPHRIPDHLILSGFDWTPDRSGSLPSLFR